MWAALALTTVLNIGPAQAGDLSIKNVRATYGVLGQTRDDKKLLPGDVLVVSFDIHNLQVKDDGRILYAMGMELTKKGKDKPDFKREPQDLEAVNTLGGSVLPAFALSVVGTDTPAGDYTLKVIIKDRSAGKTVTLEEKFEVTTARLGFVQVRLTSASGEPAPPIAVPGQSLYLHCALVGYDKSKKDSLPNVTFEMQVLDEAGKPTLRQPFKGDIRTEPKATPGLMTFQPIPLQLNRTGKFKIVLKAKCNVCGKDIELPLDIQVLNR